jgi:hypothetical protein
MPPKLTVLATSLYTIITALRISAYSPQKNYRLPSLTIRVFNWLSLFLGAHASPHICHASVDESTTSVRKCNNLCLSTSTHIRSPSSKITISGYVNHRLMVKPTLTPRARRWGYLMGYSPKDFESVVLNLLYNLRFDSYFNSRKRARDSEERSAFRAS